MHLDIGADGLYGVYVVEVKTTGLWLVTRLLVSQSFYLR